jgi:hypothetical protein
MAKSSLYGTRFVASRVNRWRLHRDDLNEQNPIRIKTRKMLGFRHYEKDVYRYAEPRGRRLYCGRMPYASRLRLSRKNQRRGSSKYPRSDRRYYRSTSSTKAANPVPRYRRDQRRRLMATLLVISGRDAVKVFGKLGFIFHRQKGKPHHPVSFKWPSSVGARSSRARQRNTPCPDPRCRHHGGRIHGSNLELPPYAFVSLLRNSISHRICEVQRSQSYLAETELVVGTERTAAGKIDLQ